MDSEQIDAATAIYEQKKADRLNSIVESGGMDNEYSVKTDQGIYTMELPKRVLEQKRLLHIGTKWFGTKVFLTLPENTDPKIVADLYHKWESETRDDPDVEEKYILAILPFIRKNGQKMIMEELEMGEISALAQLYWDFMLYPFSMRAITTSNKILVKA